LTIQALLSKPNPDDGLVPEISIEYKDHYSLFEAKAREYTRKYATQNFTDSETTITTTSSSSSSSSTSSAIPTLPTDTSPNKSKLLLSSREQISVEEKKLEVESKESEESEKIGKQVGFKKGKNF